MSFASRTFYRKRLTFPNALLEFYSAFSLALSITILFARMQMGTMGGGRSTDALHVIETYMATEQLTDTLLCHSHLCLWDSGSGDNHSEESLFYWNKTILTDSNIRDACPGGHL